MPAIGLGTWQLTEDTDGSVADALEMGYRMIDTSGDYGTQPGVGEAIRSVGVPREDIFLVTKVEEHEDALEATGSNLRELGLDHADLMLIHRPPRDGAGEALWKGLIEARDDGLTVDIGVSNYSIEQMRTIADATGEMPVVNQIEWSPFGWSPEMLEFCDAEGILIQAYSPLTRARRLDDPGLTEIAADHEATPAQLLLRWNLQHGVAPIPKASQHDHRQENLEVFDFEIGGEEMRALDEMNEHYSALGSLAYI
ncbi:MAG: aldo/keto reductase [Actinobacteria bacterium]|nr:aldo/keto reductase [Actinomycetota bacterium]